MKSAPGAKRTRRAGGEARPVSILLVEDNRLFRVGLAAVLKRQAGLRLLSVARSLEPVLQRAGAKHPDVILLDIGLQGRSSLQTVRGIREAYPASKLVMMGLVPQESEVLALVKQGVSGFLLKDATSADFVASIRAVAAGETVFPATLTGSLLSQIVRAAAQKGQVQLADVKLTAREREVVDGIADGLSNKEIASRLHIATDTVKSHVHNILEKLSLRSRVDVAVQARR